MSEADAILAMWRRDSETREKAGHFHGSQETLAWMVVHGGGHIMGRWVPVRFDWPDEQFAQRVRGYCLRILEIASGRQEGPPEQQERA